MEYFLVVGAYLVGSIPFGLVFGKLAGVDVRTQGSCNIGATNVTRLVGKKFGILTLVFDVLKGIIPMMLAASLLAESGRMDIWVALCGGAAFLGRQMLDE